MKTSVFNYDLPGHRFCINTAALRGVWERKDGSEGGVLFFDRLASGALYLTDFGGACALPLAIVGALRAAGVFVSDNPDEATSPGVQPGLLQDDSRELSSWFSSRPGARRLVGERCAEIRAALPMAHAPDDDERARLDRLLGAPKG